MGALLRLKPVKIQAVLMGVFDACKAEHSRRSQQSVKNDRF